MKLKFTILIFFFIPTYSLAHEVCFKFTGINEEININIIKELKLTEQQCIKDPPRHYASNHFLKSAIKKSIQPLGYLHPHILLRQISRQQNKITITYQILLGRPIIIQSITVRIEGPGEYNREINQFVNHFPLKSGDVFNSNHYNLAKKKLIQTMRNEGYLMLLTQNKIKIDAKRNLANIKIAMNTGPRYFFGSVKDDTKIYSSDFICRMINFTHQDHFSNKRLLQFQQDMEDSYYFDTVSLMPHIEPEKTHHVPINLKYTVPKKAKYTVGGGYGTYTGPRISASASLRRLNNIGHHFEAQLNLSSVLSNANANYFIPGKNPLEDQYFFGANAKTFQPKMGKSKSITLSAGYIKKVHHFQMNTGFNFLFERFAYNNFNPVKTHELYPNFGMSYFATDNITNPNYGFYLAFNLMGAAQELLSTNTFIQSELKGKIIFSLFNFSKIVLRGNLGALSVNELRTFPFSLRFFAGGINSIRGFAESSIGPGKYLYIGSMEYRQKVKGNWYAALFYDAGNATDTWNTPINRGIGVGIVYESMMGPIKLYLASARSKPDHPRSIEFSIGPEFA